MTWVVALYRPTSTSVPALERRRKFRLLMTAIVPSIPRNVTAERAVAIAKRRSRQPSRAGNCESAIQISMAATATSEHTRIRTTAPKPPFVDRNRKSALTFRIFIGTLT